MKKITLLFLLISFCGGNSAVIDEVETLSEIDIYTDNIYKIDLVTTSGVADLEY